MGSPYPITLEGFPSKKARQTGFFVDQPGIEPRFSEPKSDVIAFIPLVNVLFQTLVFKSECKGTAKKAYVQIF